MPQPQFLTPQEVTILAASNYEKLAGLLPAPNQLLVIREDESNYFDGMGTVSKAVILKDFSQVADGSQIQDHLEQQGIIAVYFPDGVEQLPTACLAANQGLIFCKLPNSLREIPGACFAECQALTSIIIPPSVTAIGDDAFAGIQAQDITIPDTVTTIGEGAFEGVPHITYHGSATGAPWGALSMN